MAGTRRALLVSEVGAGAGHVTRLRRIALALAARGVETTAAVFKQTHAGVVAPFVTDVLPAPGWPGLWGQPAVLASRTDGSAPTYADMLFKLGLGNAAHVRANQMAWDGLLRLVKPDVIIGDYAPGALLAAAGRMPAMAVGTGFTVPAVRDGHIVFERLLPEAEKHAQQSMFASIAQGAALSARPGAPSALAALTGDAACPASLPEFDPSFHLRVGPLLPPEMDELPVAGLGLGQDILAYFGDEAVKLAPMLPSLAGLGRVVRLHAPGLPGTIAATLAAAGIVLEPMPFPQAVFAREAALVVHHGGLGVCQLAALAGVPQFILYRTGERWSNAQAVIRMGAGSGLHSNGLESAAFRLAGEQVLAAPETREAALRWASAASKHCAGRRGQDVVADRCLELLNRRVPNLHGAV